jgi:hypothetical protein
MRGAQCGRLGEERYFWWFLVDEDIATYRGGATLERDNFLRFEGEKGRETNFEEASCTQRCEHGQNFIDLHRSFGLRPRKDLLQLHW